VSAPGPDRAPAPEEHPHWAWRAQPLRRGPVVVIDIDGVLSDAASRQHYLEGPERDWRGFFDACGEDPLIEEMKVLLDHLDPALGVVLLTARPLRVRPATEAWLRRYGIRWDLLVMRPPGRSGLALDFKRDTLGALATAGYEPRLAVEDDRRNVEMFRAEGVPCIYFHSGYYD
jgi:hypothetical protein